MEAAAWEGGKDGERLPRGAGRLSAGGSVGHAGVVSVVKTRGGAIVGGALGFS